MSSTKTVNAVVEKEEIICEELIVIGDVHNESIIDTSKLTVEGSTSTGSTQFSKYATIQKHEGIIRCHEAKIALLQDGEIHATTASVNTVKGGSIYAQDVNIQHLCGDATIYASNSINIEHISGENNKLMINYQEIPILISKMELIQDDITELNSSLNKAIKENSSLQKEIEIEISRMNKEITAIQNSSKTAKITIENTVITKNIISFHVNEKQDISFETSKEKYSPFYLSYSKNSVTLNPTSHTITLNS